MFRLNPGDRVLPTEQYDDNIILICNFFMCHINNRKYSVEKLIVKRLFCNFHIDS